MTVIRAAGPSHRLQVVRLGREERTSPASKYAVRLLEPTGAVVLATAPRYRYARWKFEEEVAWRGWTVHTPDRAGEVTACA